MDRIYPWMIVTGVALGFLLRAERDKSLPRRIVFKVVASNGFLLTALTGGALNHAYGRLVLAGLVLSWFGDVFLLWRNAALFQAGLVSFLLAHVAYSSAFVVAGLNPWTCLAGIVLLVPVVIGVVRWLIPKVTADMHIPVISYIAVITAMVTLAAGASGIGGRYLIILGAVIFFVSDIFVARDRFVAPGFSNTLCGLPLYYGGQILLAYSVTLFQ